MQIFINGAFFSEAEAKISVFDHGFLYGDGIFEGIRVYNSRIFKLDEHLDRLYDSAKAIMLDIPLSREELTAATLETCKKSNIYDKGYIRLVVSRGAGDLGLDIRKCKKASVIIIASTLSLYPTEFYEIGMAIVTVPTRRNLAESVNPAIKSLNYLNNILAKIEAVNAGVEEAVMLNQEGFVAECTGDNIFIIKNGTLLTPPVYMGVLDGITRQTAMQLARGLNIPVEEKAMTRYDLYTADECFLTGSAAEIIPVNEIDKRVIGDGKAGALTRKLIERFREFVKTQGTVIPR
ncbi:MAG: branched-chain-amino-acid transaminase [Spirochaetae bacterium HGW-Spirochaetae-6]|nr:MAG: branched-chain-amino-acid transaminase [Spirochaetae bacterium HGW-Spirochaetae-6]